MAKGIGIILVFYGHSIPFGNPLGHALVNWIYMFHMPLFYIISGMCFNHQRWISEMPWSMFIIRRTRQLLLPLLAFTAFYICFSAITGMNTYSYADFLLGKWPPAMWFIMSLFLAETAYYVIHRCLPSHPTSTNILLIALLTPNVIIISYRNWGELLPFSFSTLHISLFFFVVGQLARNYIMCIYNTWKRDCDNSRRKRIDAALATVSAAMLLLLPMLFILTCNDTLQCSAAHIPSPYHLSLPASLAGVAGVMLMSMFLDLYIHPTWMRRILIFLGRNTLVILAFHLTFFKLSHIYIKPLVGFDLGPIYTWLLLIPIIYVINRWLPWLAGRPRIERN